MQNKFDHLYLFVTFVVSLLINKFLKLNEKLKNITSIHTGVYAKPSIEGDLVYLQSKDFDESGNLLNNGFEELLSVDVNEKHFLNEGDVLFAAKGSKNFASAFKNHHKTAVASTSFFVLRVSTDRLLPAYLSWFLNNSATQAFLKNQALGTSIPSISKQVLMELEIPVPDLETQKAVLQIAELRMKEKSLKQEIESLREKQIQQQIMNVLNKNKI